MYLAKWTKIQSTQGIGLWSKVMCCIKDQFELSLHMAPGKPIKATLSTAWGARGGSHGLSASLAHAGSTSSLLKPCLNTTSLCVFIWILMHSMLCSSRRCSSVQNQISLLSFIEELELGTDFAETCKIYGSCKFASLLDLTISIHLFIVWLEESVNELLSVRR